MFHKLLIANRGEIACRIIQTAKALNISTVAVYSEADKNARHVKLADFAYFLGKAPASESYLNIDKIIQAARETQANAIHPGYGFLSENAEFARAVEKANLIFIGPPATAIECMGSKAQAKALMAKANVPLIPGYHGHKQDQNTLTEQAQHIGFPLLIKASHGGGGKGMRVVHHLSEFNEKLAACQREAEKSFASNEVILEKYLEKPRHIEIQIFVDQQGNGVYLFERDCSIQRRHQKIIEEAPAIHLPSEIRKQMGEAAVHAAKSIGYVGAGTIEFLYSDKQFYFMEMNTRLQVEHPVTEAITGEDLVAWQLMIAAGQPLPKTQNALGINGHALEMRVYAEDPLNQFLPATGTIEQFLKPKTNRIDHGLQPFDKISIHYDPMLAKVIIHGTNRAHCISEAKRALEKLHIIGLVTNISFLRATLDQTAYQEGHFDTHFIEDHEASLKVQLNHHLPLALALASQFHLEHLKSMSRTHTEDPYSPWHDTTGWRSLAPHPLKLSWFYRNQQFDIVLNASHTTFYFEVNDHSYHYEFYSKEKYQYQIKWQNKFLTVYIYPYSQGYYVSITGYQYYIEYLSLHQNHEMEHQANELTAPMPGIIRKILVHSGTEVSSKTPLMILEAMKMEHTIIAPRAGKITSLNYKEGDTVEEGALLLALDTGEP